MQITLFIEQMKDKKQLTLQPQWSSTVLLIGILSLGASFNIGCGKSMVTAVNISTEEVNHDRYADLDIQFRTNGIALPTIALPIFDPSNPSQNFGELELKQISSSIGQAKVGVNLSVVARLPSGDPTLPNGNAIPLAGTSSASKVLSIPIPTTAFVLYLAIEMNAINPSQSPLLMMGLALPFRQLDSIGQSIGNSQMFLPFNVQGVTGTAGLFASKDLGKSGFGFFIDFAGLIPQKSTPAVISQFQLSTLLPQPRKLQFLYQHPGAKAESRIQKKLHLLGKKRTQLTVQ